jgi:MFS family permease
MDTKYLSFFGLCLGFFIVMMDISTIPLTYTTLMNVFHVSPAEVAWINNIYLVTYAVCLLLGGQLGDFTNRKMVVLFAYLILGLGAALGGAGQSFSGVLIGRAIMGVGAGLLTPQSMAFISILFAKGGRGTALGIWGAVAGIATAMGPVVTQLFLIIASWRYVMWINIPIALICFLIGMLHLPSMAGSGIKFRNMFIFSRTLWADHAFLKICFISGLLGAGVTAFYLPLVFLLDVRMSFGPAEISIIMMTIALSNALVGPFAGKMSDRVEPKIMVKRGLILFACANALLGAVGMLIPAGHVAFIALCLVMAIGGSGTGCAFAPLANLALSRTKPETVGSAAAFYNCVRQVFSALGGVIIAIAFDAMIRLQIRNGMEVTADNLRQLPNVTAIACLICFILIAFFLFMAASVCQSKNEEAALGELV